MQQFLTSSEPLINGRLRRASRFVVAAVVAVFALLMGTSRVEATCGDYLSHQSADSHAMGNDDSMIPLTGFVPKQKPPCPCRGASCQSAPANVPVPPVSQVVDTEDECLWVWLSNKPATTQISALDRISELFVAPMIAYRLDRPPNA